MEKLGAEFKGEVMVAYHGEPTKQNVEYWIKKKTGNNYIQPFSALAPK